MSNEDLHRVSFEDALQQLKSVVNRLESGDLSLEEALDVFEQGVQYARHGQQILQHAEQRVRILLADDKDADLVDFNVDNA